VVERVLKGALEARLGVPRHAPGYWVWAVAALLLTGSYLFMAPVESAGLDVAVLGEIKGASDAVLGAAGRLLGW